MAFRKPVQKKSQPTLEVPALYGSHESMLGGRGSDGVNVHLRDEKGLYTTTVDRLDTGLADPRRYDRLRHIDTPNVKAVVKR